MLNLQMPFIYRLETKDDGPVHINTLDIITIKNSDNNSNWSLVESRQGFTYVSYLSPEELVADILNSYNLTMKAYR